MTIPELIAFAIGAALVGIAWMACHWATIAARTPRTPDPDPVEGEGAARPTATALLPLARMSREEVQQHLQRLKPDWTPPADLDDVERDWDRVNRALTNLDAVDWDRNTAVWLNTDPFLHSPTVRTVDLSAPEPEPLEDER